MHNTKSTTTYIALLHSLGGTFFCNFTVQKSHIYLALVIDVSPQFKTEKWTDPQSIPGKNPIHVVVLVASRLLWCPTVCMVDTDMSANICVLLTKQWSNCEKCGTNRKCTGLHCIKEQLLLCKQIFFSFSLIHTVLKYNGCCLQSSWRLSCKLQRTMRIWKFPKVFFFFFLVQRSLYPVLPKFAQHYPATTSQPVCQYTLFPNDQRLPGGLQPVSRLVWPRP